MFFILKKLKKRVLVLAQNVKKQIRQIILLLMLGVYFKVNLFAIKRLKKQHQNIQTIETL